VRDCEHAVTHHLLPNIRRLSKFDNHVKPLSIPQIDSPRRLATEALEKMTANQKSRNNCISKEAKDSCCYVAPRP
jgi:hypothetical protein